jgi:hypothetical protein
MGDISISGDFIKWFLFKIFYFILSFLYLLTYVYIIWATSPTYAPTSGRTCSAILFYNTVEVKTLEMIRKHSAFAGLR